MRFNLTLAKDILLFLADLLDFCLVLSIFCNEIVTSLCRSVPVDESLIAGGLIAIIHSKGCGHTIDPVEVHLKEGSHAIGSDRYFVFLRHTTSRK